MPLNTPPPNHDPQFNWWQHPVHPPGPPIPSQVQFPQGGLAQGFDAVAAAYDLQWEPDEAPIKATLKQRNPEPLDGQTAMNIQTTKCSKIVKYKAFPEVVPDVSAAHSEYVDILKSLKVELPTYRFLPKIDRGGETLVGIEIELENWVHEATNPKLFNGGIQESLAHKFMKVWEATVDPSLRNNGQELISKAGLKAKDVPKALSLLRLYLDSFQGKVQWNYRCGTHVHFDVRDFTVEQLINLTFLYVLFEDLFYRVSGERYKNIFCVPIRASSAQLEYLFKLIHNPKPTYQDFRNVFKHFKKYSAFNLLPAGKADTSNGHHDALPIGTVEFRHHKGESNAFVLTKWIQLGLDIHTAAQQTDFPSLKDKIFRLNGLSNYMEFAREVFTVLPPQFTQEEIALDMYEGSSYLKELFITSKGVV